MADSPDYKGVVSVGVDLGTSTSKFCDGNQILYFSSVAGDALTDQLETSWRRMNRSTDQRWHHNLAIWDESRKGWRYLGAMTRNSQRQQWFTEGGVIQNFDDAYNALQAGLSRSMGNTTPIMSHPSRGRARFGYPRPPLAMQRLPMRGVCAGAD